MFVAIENKDKSPIDLEGDIQVTRNEGRITPEYAMEILSLTNFRTNIKKLVRAIKDKCKTKEDILPYKDFIVSCVDSREVSEEALADLHEMATLCGCEKEFEEANGKPKFYGKFDCDNTVIVKSIEEFKALEGENLKVYFDADKVDFGSCDLSKVKGIKIKDGAEVKLSWAQNLPKDLDVSMCSKVNLSWCDLEGLNLKFREGAEVDLHSSENLPKDLDLSMCSKVYLRYCDLEGLKLKFKEGAEVYLGADFYSAENLPKDLDVSMCSKVDLSNCNLEGLKLKFKEGAVVNLSGCKNLPKDLDVSMCDVVHLDRCDLSGVKEIKFREGAEVDFLKAKNLPKELDVSMCSKVDLGYCDLEGINLKFREGADVDLHSAKNLPEVLDLSMCDKVDLTKCDLSGVERVTFKDKKQEKIFMEGAKNFRGKVVYADEDKKEKEDNSLFSRIRKRFGAGEMGE